jgi:hypothetical protein
MNFDIVNKMTTLVAKRNSGKSYLLKYLVTLRKDQFEKIFVICPTENINSFYQLNDFIPKNCIYDKYNESFIDKLIERMTIQNKNKKAEQKKHVLLILDDLVADVKFHQSESLKKLFVRGRHVAISVIITSQFLTGIPPVARINSDFICVGQVNKEGLDILCEQYIVPGMTKDDFIEIYKENTRDYSFLVINNNSTKSDDPNESYGNIKTPQEFLDANKI